jgi:hypothetical protein
MRFLVFLILQSIFVFSANATATPSPSRVPSVSPSKNPTLPPTVSPTKLPSTVPTLSSTQLVDLFTPNEELISGPTQYQVKEIRIDNSSWESGEAVVVDSNQTMYVLSNFVRNHNYDSAPHYSSDSDSEWVGLITKYSNDGSKVFSTTIPHLAAGLAFHEKSKSIYTIGNRKKIAFFHKFTDFGVKVFNQTSAVDYSYHKVTVDHEGNVFLLGRFFYDGISALLFLRKMSPEGNTTWEHKYNGIDSRSPIGLAIDQRNNIFVFGSTGTRIPFLQKYDSLGVLLFHKTFHVEVTQFQFAVPSTIFIQNRDNRVYVAGSLSTETSSSFIFRCSMTNGSVLESWLGSSQDSDGYALTQLIVDSENNKYLAYAEKYKFYSQGDGVSLNALAIHETSEEVTVYATGYAAKRKRTTNEWKGIDIVITQTSSVKPADIPWYLMDPIALYAVMVIIGIGIVVGLIWLIFSSFREYTRMLFKNPSVCRLYYSGLGILEVADIVSDALWMAALGELEGYYGYYSNRMFGTLAVCFWTFLCVSLVLIVGKIKYQFLRRINLMNMSNFNVFS